MVFFETCLHRHRALAHCRQKAFSSLGKFLRTDTGPIGDLIGAADQDSILCLLLFDLQEDVEILHSQEPPQHIRFFHNIRQIARPIDRDECDLQMCHLWQGILHLSGIESRELAVFVHIDDLRHLDARC